MIRYIQLSDPFGWADRVLSPRWSHLVGRIAVIAVLLVFLGHRLGQYRLYLFKPLWVVETLIFVAFIVTYAIRVNPVDRSRGIKEIAIPLLGGLLPFALLLTPPAPWVAASREALRMIFVWMTLSTGLTVWGLWSIRSAFSITVEARALVTKGPYRWIRHPVYLGEVLTAAAVILWRASLLNVALFCLFLAVQLCRSRWEETKLARVFPDYPAYAARAWWFWSYLQ